MRESNRYIGFEVMSQKKISSFEIVRDAIEGACRNIMGDLGLAAAGLIVVKNTWNEGSQRGVIKVERSFADHVKAALVFISDIKGQQVLVHSITTSGMINKAKKRLVSGG